MKCQNTVFAQNISHKNRIKLKANKDAISHHQNITEIHFDIFFQTKNNFPTVNKQFYTTITYFILYINNNETSFKYPIIADRKECRFDFLEHRKLPYLDDDTELGDTFCSFNSQLFLTPTCHNG